MHDVPFHLIAAIAAEAGAVECCWRESERSFTGFVAEVWFESLPHQFAVQWAGVVGYAIAVRRRDDGPAAYAVSVPCFVTDIENEC